MSKNCFGMENGKTMVKESWINGKYAFLFAKGTHLKFGYSIYEEEKSSAYFFKIKRNESILDYQRFCLFVWVFFRSVNTICVMSSRSVKILELEISDTW